MIEFDNNCPHSGNQKGINVVTIGNKKGYEKIRNYDFSCATGFLADGTKTK